MINHMILINYLQVFREEIIKINKEKIIWFKSWFKSIKKNNLMDNIKKFILRIKINSSIRKRKCLKNRKNYIRRVKNHLLFNNHRRA